MVSSLDLRDVSRLHGVSSLLFLSFPTPSNQETTPTQLIKGITSLTSMLIEIILKNFLIQSVVIVMMLTLRTLPNKL